MTIDFIDAASEQGTFAPLGGEGLTWLRFLGGQEASYIHEQDEAAIEAEDYWGQADEACAVDPIG